MQATVKFVFCSDSDGTVGWIRHRQGRIPKVEIQKLFQLEDSHDFAVCKATNDEPVVFGDDGNLDVDEEARYFVYGTLQRSRVESEEPAQKELFEAVDQSCVRIFVTERRGETWDRIRVQLTLFREYESRLRLGNGWYPARLDGPANRNHRKQFKKNTAGYCLHAFAEGEAPTLARKSRNRLGHEVIERVPTAESQIARWLWFAHTGEGGTGHEGRAKMELRLDGVVHIPELKQMCQLTCNSCAVHQAARVDTSEPLIGSYRTTRPMERLFYDFFEMPRTERPAGVYRYVLLLVCQFSKFVWGVATTSKEAAVVADFLSGVFKGFGAPQFLHSDNAGEFVKVSKLLAEQHRFKDKHGKPYTPHQQGMIERSNQTIGNWLTKHEIFSRVNWVDALPQVLHDYNRSPSTITGVAPFLAFFGQHDNSATVPILAQPLDETARDQLFRKILERQDLARARDVRKRQKKARVMATPVFTEGDRVMVKLPPGHKAARLERLHMAHCAYIYVRRRMPAGGWGYVLQWISPGLSGEFPGQHSSLVYTADQLRAVSGDVPLEDLQSLVTSKRTTKQDPSSPTEAEDQEEAEEWVVEDVLAKRVHQDGKQYLVKWDNFGLLESTWEPEDHVKHLENLDAVTWDLTGVQEWKEVVTERFGATKSRMTGKRKGHGSDRRHEDLLRKHVEHIERKLSKSKRRGARLAFKTYLDSLKAQALQSVRKQTVIEKELDKADMIVVSSDEEPVTFVHEIEAVLARRDLPLPVVGEPTCEYLVHWKGHDVYSSDWIPKAAFNPEFEFPEDLPDLTPLSDSGVLQYLRESNLEGFEKPKKFGLPEGIPAEQLTDKPDGTAAGPMTKARKSVRIPVEQATQYEPVFPLPAVPLEAPAPALLPTCELLPDFPPTGQTTRRPHRTPLGAEPALAWANNVCHLLQGFLEPLYLVARALGVLNEILAERPHSEVHRSLQACLSVRSQAAFATDDDRLRAPQWLWWAATNLPGEGYPRFCKIGQFANAHHWYRLLDFPILVGTVLNTCFTTTYLRTGECEQSRCPRNLPQNETSTVFAVAPKSKHKQQDGPFQKAKKINPLEYLLRPDREETRPSDWTACAQVWQRSAEADVVCPGQSRSMVRVDQVGRAVAINVETATKALISATDAHTATGQYKLVFVVVCTGMHFICRSRQDGTWYEYNEDFVAVCGGFKGTDLPVRPSENTTMMGFVKSS